MSHLRAQSILCTTIFAISTLGCRSVQLASYSANRASDSSATESRSESIAPKTEKNTDSTSRWPTRWGNNPDHRGTIIEMDPKIPMRPIHLSRYHQYRTTEIEYNDANTLAADMGITTGFKFKSEAPGSFLFVPNPKNEPVPDITLDNGTLTKATTPDLSFKFVSATPATRDSSPAEDDQDFVLLQRTWFTYRDPKEKDADPIGTIVILPGMFGTPDMIVDAVENYWHHQGYAILRMRSQPSRFSEHTEFRIAPGIAVTIANDVARMNDDRVAEGAYATKAAIDYVNAQRSELADKPTVLIGMSGGAMMLPTVYAYAPQSYDAAVIIAGGANFLEIALDSNYKEWIDAITFDFDPDPNKAGKIEGRNRENLMSDYLKFSKLDAYYTATEMSDIPVLVLHASLDKAVPARTGELLYKQLGQPERWSYPLGHELIFAGLPTQVARIDRWLTKHLDLDSLSTTPSSDE